MYCEEEVEEILAAARASQRQANDKETQREADRKASLRARKPLKAEGVWAWLAEVKERRNEDGSPFLRAAQFEAVRKVASRVVHELNTMVEPGLPVEDPLLWCLHGLPGTGKSHVLKVLSEELFQKQLGWEMGMEFQVVALQAVIHSVNIDL